jgi:outer membrane protein TolC
MKIRTAGDIAERKRKLYVRKSYLPEVALGAGADQAFVREGTIRNPQLPVPEPPDDITWNVGVSMRFPLFEGAKRRNELKRTVLEQEKIEWQKEELITNMQAGIRSTVQQLQASFKDLELSENAARAAEENFGMVQDAYVQGAVGVVELVDAQNMMIRTKTLAVNARYRYVLNYVDAERLQGDYSFLKDAEGHQEYVESLSEYLFGL